MPRLLFQLGRLDRNMLQQYAFNLDGGGSGCASLSSLALCQAHEDETFVRLFFPVSLPFQLGFQIDPYQRCGPPWAHHTAFIEQVERVWRSPHQYLHHPDALFEHHPHVVQICSLGATVPESLPPYAVLPAFGQYPYPHAGGKKTVAFVTPPWFIELAMLVDMLASYLALLEHGKQVEEVGYDTSSGLNVYVGMMWSAFRYLSTCLQLFHLGDDACPRFVVYASEPVSATAPGAFRIHKLPLLAQWFFEYPRVARPQGKQPGGNVQAACAVFHRDSGRAKQLAEALAEGAYIWAATQYGIPLYLAYTARDDPADQAAKVAGLLRDVVDELRRETAAQARREQLQGHWNQDRATACRHAALALCLYRGLLTTLARLGECLQWAAFDDGDGVEIKSLRDFYEELAQRAHCGPASLFVESEVERTRDVLRRHFKTQKKQKRTLGKWLCLAKAHGADSSRIKPRNFLAHCGLVGPVAQGTVIRRSGSSAATYVRLRTGDLSKLRAQLHKAVFCADSADRTEPYASRQNSESTAVTKGMSGGASTSNVADDTRAQIRRSSLGDGTYDARAQETGEVTQSESGQATKLCQSTRRLMRRCFGGWNTPEEALRQAAVGLVRKLRRKKLYGPCLYWAERLGVLEEVPDKVRRLAMRALPLEAPDWHPTYDAVKVIDHVRTLLELGMGPPPRKLLATHWLRGKVRRHGQGGVWIMVQGIGEFFAAQGELPNEVDELAGKEVRFRLRVRRHPDRKVLSLMAVEVAVLGQQR